MASAPLLLLLVATAAPAAVGDRAPADVLTAPSDGLADSGCAIAAESAVAPKKRKKDVAAPRFTVVREHAPPPPLVKRQPPRGPVRPGSPRGPPA